MASTVDNSAGISPVLLQAISERLGSKGGLHKQPAKQFQNHFQIIKNSKLAQIQMANELASNVIISTELDDDADCVQYNHSTDMNSFGHQMLLQGEKAITIPSSILVTQSQSKVKPVGNVRENSVHDSRVNRANINARVMERTPSVVQEVVLCYPDDTPQSDGEGSQSRSFLRQDDDEISNVMQYTHGSTAESGDDAGVKAFPGVVESGEANKLSGLVCPICGDRVSGYHYGVVSCESCKGFFKRTVQNRRTFVCPRQGDCHIVIGNRKKCPSCRFARCMLAGMRVEAIRTDRSRGGRSYYEGCSPRIRPKTERPKKITPKPYSRASNPSQSHLVAILSAQRPSLVYIPQLLVDIMNLDSMLDDKGVLELDIREDTNMVMLTKLLQLAELRLYKLVRWARALPQFSSIPTEDQIILLQNSWLDLLILGVAYSSMHHPGKVHITTCHEWSLDEAHAVNMEMIFGYVVNLADLMSRLKLDKYECAVLKVLAIITPDVDGLTARTTVLDHQLKLTEALHLYTAGHYPGQHNRFSSILLVLSGLIKASLLGKSLLSSESLGEHFYQCDLLMELIQGRNNPGAT